MNETWQVYEHHFSSFLTVFLICPIIIHHVKHIFYASGANSLRHFRRKEVKMKSFYYWRQICVVCRKAWKWVTMEVCLPSEQVETEIDASCLDALLKLLYEKDLSAVPGLFVYSWWLWKAHLTGDRYKQDKNLFSFILYITIWIWFSIYRERIWDYCCYTSKKSARKLSTNIIENPFVLCFYLAMAKKSLCMYNLSLNTKWHRKE